MAIGQSQRELKAHFEQNTSYVWTSYPPLTKFQFVRLYLVLRGQKAQIKYVLTYKLLDIDFYKQ